MLRATIQILAILNLVLPRLDHAMSALLFATMATYAQLTRVLPLTVLQLASSCL